MTELPIRNVTPEQVPEFERLVAQAFGELISDETIAQHAAVKELDRTFAVFEGERIVATAETISFTVGMPGRPPAPCAGLTSVSVHPARRRRGLLARLMRHQLEDAHERGEPFASLYASESAIYGRFGYGPAGPTVDLSGAVPGARLASPDPLPADFDLVPAGQGLDLLPQIYERVQASTPGMMSRPPGFWRVMLSYDPAESREGHTPYQLGVVPGRGYVLYRIKEGWRDHVPNSTLRVVELMATDDEAYAALWHYCLTLDLIAHVRAPLRPPDDPIRSALADHLRLRATSSDPLYLRLLSLPEAFAARTYSAAAEVVVAVRDATCPWNQGTWRLELGPDGGSCSPTTADPDLELDVSDLGTAFLGGVHLTQLVRARRVTEHRPGAAWALDRALAADPMPWNPRIF